MTKKYVSLEHSIRDVLTESVGVIGSSEYRGVPAGFGRIYSSRPALKGRHGVHSIAANRDISLRKTVGQAEGGINFGDAPKSAELSAQGAPQESGGKTKKIEEKVSDDKDEGKAPKKTEKNSNVNMINTNPLVKHRTFFDQFLNPQGKAHPPLQPPMPAMMIPPAPQQQMMPREGGMPSTTPGAVPMMQTARAEGGEDKKSGEKSNSILDQELPAQGASPVPQGQGPGQMPGQQAGAPHPADGVKAAGDVAHALGNLLHHHSQQVAAQPSAPHDPGAVQGHNHAPVLNEPQSKDKGKQVPPAAVPAEQPQKGKWGYALDSLMGKETSQQRQDYNAQRDSKRWQDQPGRKTGKTQKEQPDMIQPLPSGHGPDNPGDVHRPNPGEKQKGSIGHLFGLDKPLPQKGSAGTQSGEAPAKDQSRLTPSQGDQKDQARLKPAASPSEKEPEQAPPSSDKKGKWGYALDALRGKETQADRDQYNKERDEKAAKEKASKQGQPGTQSGPAPEKKNWRDEPGRRTDRDPEKDPKSIHRDKGPVPDGPGHTNPGEKIKGGKVPVGATLGIKDEKPAEHSPYQEPAGKPPSGGKLSTMTLGPHGEDPEGMDAAYQKFKKFDDPEKQKIYGDPNKSPWQKYKEGWKLNKQRQDQQYEKEHPGEKAPGGQWGNPEPVEKAIDKYGKYGKAALVALGLLGGNALLDRMFGGGHGGGHGGLGSDRPKPSGYAPVKTHDDAAWDMPTSVTMKMRRKLMALHNEEASHDNTEERRKVGFIEREHKGGNSGTKERRDVSYLERRPKKHDLRHRFTSKTLQGRETLAGMDEERFTSIMRDALNEAKAKRDKKKRTEGGFGETKVDTHPKLNPEPLDALRGP